MSGRFVGVGFFGDEEVARLREPHTFRSVDLSLVSRMLEPFWCFVAARVPARVAPNAITLAGFVCVVISFVAMISTCPLLRGSGPHFVYAAAIVSIFAFQTFDAVDGKQARKTGSSSALGSWFDHACDVAAIQLAMATTAAGVGLGPGGATLFLLGSVVFNNYVIHWETRHTGTLFMGNGTSIYEAQLTMMVVNGITLAVGGEVWGRALSDLVPPAAVLPFASTPLRLWVCVLGVGLIGGLGVVGSLVRVARAGHATLEVFRELIPPLLVLAAGAVILLVVDEHESLPFVFSVSLLGLRLIAHQILGQLAGSRVRIFDPALVPLLATALLVQVFEGSPFIGIIAWANLLFALVVTSWTYFGATFGIARALDVPILTLRSALR